MVSDMSQKQAGMTLIEVLVALAIIGIALTAVIKAASQNIRATDYLQNKTIALWVGSKVMREAQLGIIGVGGPEGLRQEQTMLGRDWFWHAEITTTANARIKKIRVRVYEREPEDDDASALIDLDGYAYAD